MHIWLDYMKLAQMSSAVAIGTDTQLWIVMVKVSVEELGLGLLEILIIDSTGHWRRELPGAIVGEVEW